MTTATFFISTARSGTQWLYHAMKDLAPDELVVEHEPVGYAYAPRQCLRQDAALFALRQNPVIRRHLDRIHEILATRSYIEVGFPVYACAPLLVREFGTRVRFVHWIRHPVRVAASLVTHKWYVPGARPEIEALIAPHPGDPGVQQAHYASRWEAMRPFERGLFYWSEVHRFGLEVEAVFTDLPFCRMRFEDILKFQAEQQRLSAFLRLPGAPCWEACASRRIDRFRFVSPHSIDPSAIQRHRGIVELAQDFGYAVEDVSATAIRNRYCGTWVRRVLRPVKHLLIAHP